MGFARIHHGGTAIVDLLVNKRRSWGVDRRSFASFKYLYYYAICLTKHTNAAHGYVINSRLARVV